MLREGQVAQAVKFLQMPDVASNSVQEKEAFLKRKGLSAEEVAEAFKRAGQQGGAPGSGDGAAGTGGGGSEQWSTQSSAAGIAGALGGGGAAWAPGGYNAPPEAAQPFQQQHQQPQQQQPQQQPQKQVVHALPQHVAPPPGGFMAFAPPARIPAPTTVVMPNWAVMPQPTTA